MIKGLTRQVTTHIAPHVHDNNITNNALHLPAHSFPVEGPFLCNMDKPAIYSIIWRFRNVKIQDTVFQVCNNG